MKLLRSLRCDTGGVSTIEFAVIAPLIMLLITGILQFGLGLWAQAGLRNAVETGARYAAIYPRPADDLITQRIRASAFGIDQSQLPAPTLAHGTSNGVPFLDIGLTYRFPLRVIFLKNRSITLRYGRRVYQY